MVNVDSRGIEKKNVEIVNKRQRVRVTEMSRVCTVVLEM